MATNNSEFEKFDATVRKVLSVSHEELKRREAEWKRQRGSGSNLLSDPALPRWANYFCLCEAQFIVAIAPSTTDPKS